MNLLAIHLASKVDAIACIISLSKHYSIGKK